MVDFLISFAQASPIFYLLCSLLLSTIFSLLFIPSLPITTVNVVVYGPVWGGVISFIAEIIAACLTFFLYRWGWTYSMEKVPPIKNKLAKKIESRAWSGFWQILFLRLIPFFPSSGVTVYALWRSIELPPYMWGSIVGKLPAMVIEVLGSLGITWLFAEQLDQIFVILLIVVFLFELQKRIKSRYKPKSFNQNQSYDDK